MKCIFELLKRGVLLAAVFLFALTAPILGQAPGPPSDRTNPDRDRQQDISRREWQLRNFGLEPKPASDKTKVQAVGEQIDQDFSRILILHNKIVRTVSSEKPLDYDFVSDASEEINKRASRLQSTLGLREPEPRPENAQKSSDLDQAQIRIALLNLCKEIKNFVTNPVIETPGTINVEELAKARRDLEKIISLSDQIKKNADSLDKQKK